MQFLKMSLGVNSVKSAEISSQNRTNATNDQLDHIKISFNVAASISTSQMFPNPSAKSFTPTSALEFAIYNDGVPSSTFYGGEHDVLQSINEEAIETCFPPSAEDVRCLCCLYVWSIVLLEFVYHVVWQSPVSISHLMSPLAPLSSLTVLIYQAAELDAAADFVETMAWLSFLDECDERARFSFEGLGKRWSARRAAGLVGKPNPMREGVTRTRSGTFTGSLSDETDLVTYAPRKFEEKPRRIGKMHGGQQYGHVARNVKTSHKKSLIQQPRKQN